MKGRCLKRRKRKWWGGDRETDR